MPGSDVDACTELGVVVSSSMHAGTPSFAAEQRVVRVEDGHPSVLELGDRQVEPRRNG